MRIKEIRPKFAMPPNVTVSVEGKLVKVKGPKGELSRRFDIPTVNFSSEDGKIAVVAKNATKSTKTQIFTAAAHIRNMLKGVSEGHVYKLKICSGHFPMNVSMSGDQFIVKNFLGEKVPRVLKIKEGAKVKIETNIVTVESTDIEKAGQVAADIELLTRITNRDIRIFQDGIYIIEKDGEPLA
jgi:large subunit ribosomal protein L6